MSVLPVDSVKIFFTFSATKWSIFGMKGWLYRYPARCAQARIRTLSNALPGEVGVIIGGNTSCPLILSDYWRGFYDESAMVKLIFL